MKVEKLLTKAKKDLKNEYEEDVLQLIKNSIRTINDCKKTLRRLEKAHNKLLKTDIDDLELDGYDYE